jgi:superfamily II DNA or RNA helicase
MVRVVARRGGEAGAFLLPADTAASDAEKPRRLVKPRQGLARLAGHLARDTRALTPNVVVPARMALLPFQLEPALAMLAGRRRILVADRVGLGKTVQAALAAESLLAVNADARVLVVAPATLLDQWAQEFHALFGRAALTGDARTLAEMRSRLPFLANPWQQPGVWLTSPDFLKQAHVRSGLPATAWQLVVIDEAHIAAGCSDRHDVLHEIAADAERVLLLTATPHDGDDRRYRRLLALGSRGDALTTFCRTDRPGRTRRHTRWLRVRLTATDIRVLDVINGLERAGRRASPAGHHEGRALICAVFRRRALSSPASLIASIDRRLEVVDQQPATGPRQPGLFDYDLFSDEEGVALEGDTGLPADTERSWLRRLRHLAGHHTAGSRALGLATLLRRAREPVVIFSQYRDSLPSICAVIPRVDRAAVIHGGLTQTERRQLLGRFLNGAADVLVATDVASQGLNLQSLARWVISFDIPWTPLRLEQRIGRVDRIGQQRLVHATLLTTRHAFDEKQRHALRQREHRRDAAPVETALRWRRAATALAARYQLQRELGRRWRHHTEPQAVDVELDAAVLRRLAPRHRGGLIVWEVVLTTGQGVVLERRVVTTASDVPAEVVTSAFGRRAATLTARWRRVAQTARTHALPKAPRQPGLFGHVQPDAEAAETPAEHEPDVVTAGPARILLEVRVRRRRL